MLLISKLFFSLSELKNRMDNDNNSDSVQLNDLDENMENLSTTPPPNQIVFTQQQRNNR